METFIQIASIIVLCFVTSYAMEKLQKISESHCSNKKNI